MWMWRWVVIRYAFSAIEPRITMYCVRNWLTDKQFCEKVHIAPWTLNNWRKTWSIPITSVHRLKRYINIDFMELTPVNTDGVE
jgi:hypothetical protein